MRSQPIVLDALDQRLLRHFARRFPRPSTVPFCPYDVSAQAVELLCTHPRPFDPVPRSAGDGVVATDALTAGTTHLTQSRTLLSIRTTLSQIDHDRRLQHV